MAGMIERGNVMPPELAIFFLSELDGMIQSDIMLHAPEEIVSYTDQEQELLLRPPHDGIYVSFLVAMIRQTQGEFEGYENAQAVVNEKLETFKEWYVAHYDPAETASRSYVGGTPAAAFGFAYLTAYGLAVKHRYQGTEEEWLASLKGAPGAAALMRYDQGTGMVQWGVGGEWYDLLSLAELWDPAVDAIIERAEEAANRAEQAMERAGMSAQIAKASMEGAQEAADRAEAAAEKIGPGGANLTGYAEKDWVREGFQPKGDYLTAAPVASVNGQTGEVRLSADDVGAMPAETKIPGKTSELTNDSGFIDKAVSDLRNYYTKAQTQELIAAIPRFRVAVVQQLPSPGEELVLYLVPFAGTEGQYVEYIWVENRFEIIGIQQVDLTGYATEDWVRELLADTAGDYLPMPKAYNAGAWLFAEEVDGKGKVSKTGTKVLDWVATHTSRVDPSDQVLVPEVTLQTGITNAFGYDTLAGQTEVLVVCDGKLHLCNVEFDYSEGDGYFYHLGNKSLLFQATDTGEPFFFHGYKGTSTMAHFSTAGEHTVEIYGGKETLIYNKLPEEYLPDGVVRTVNGVAPDENGNVNVAGGSGSGQSVSQNRKYVEEFKTGSNTWNDAFAELFAYCQENGCVACTGGTQYVLTAPLYIGDIDVDFESCELYNNVAESKNNPACVVLTGAQKRIQKFGTVTGRQSVGILVNTEAGLYKFNRLYAKLIQGWSGALWLSTTEYTCCFNEFHVPLLKSADVALKTWCESRKTKWVNECHFYLASIEQYRSTYPTKLIEMTNATRCNIYNVDLECGDWQTPDPNRTVEVELTDCSDVAFYNPRTKEGYNAVQFRFIGECYDNFIDAEYSKYRTVDSSRMVMSDFHCNVWRGRTVTGNAGSVTNAKNLRIYKNMVVPEMLRPMVVEVTADKTISADMMATLNKVATGKHSMGGIPTLLKWSAGNITIDKRFIALLPTVIQIMRVSDTVGNVMDMDGNVILPGTELETNKRCDIRVDSATYVTTEAIGEEERKYLYFYDISLAIGDFVEEAAKEWTGEETVTHPFVDGFVRTAGTINTTSTNYKYTGLVKYKGGSVDFRAISASAGVSCAIVAFFDNEQTFLGSLETAVGGHNAFYERYNTGEYTALNGSDIGADVMGGTITAEQIAQWYPATAYIAVSCPTDASGITSTVYNAIDNPCMATQTY